MIKLKGNDNAEATYQTEKVTQALAGGPKKKLWGQDQHLYEKSKPVAVSIRGNGPTEAMSDVHDVFRKHDGLLDNREELGNGGSDSDDLFGDADDELDRIRSSRMSQLQKQGGIIQKFKNKGHGRLNTINEEEFLRTVTESNLAIVHFFHKEFERCAIIDKHLQILAPKYLPVMFARLDAEKAPFFIEKLKIKVLPTIILFRDGIAVDRIVGFEDLNNNDSFPTQLLERRMKKSKVLRSLTKDGEEVEGDEEDEEARKRGAAIRIGKNVKAVEDNDLSD